MLGMAITNPDGDIGPDGHVKQGGEDGRDLTRPRSRPATHFGAAMPLAAESPSGPYRLGPMETGPRTRFSGADHAARPYL